MHFPKNFRISEVCRDKSESRRFWFTTRKTTKMKPEVTYKAAPIPKSADITLKTAEINYKTAKLLRNCRNYYLLTYVTTKTTRITGQAFQITGQAFQITTELTQIT